MNVITVLTQDHRNVDELFARYERLGPQDAEEKRRVVDLIIEQLSRHAVAEEEVVYPALQTQVQERADDVLEAVEEHHLVKLTLNELEKMAPTNPRFDAKVRVLIENVRHHVEEEEGEGGLFDVARQRFGTAELDRLGEQVEQAKRTAPSRPHPFSPDQPPLNLILGPAVAVFDRVVKPYVHFMGRVATQVTKALPGRNAA